ISSTPVIFIILIKSGFKKEKSINSVIQSSYFHRLITVVERIIIDYYCLTIMDPILLKSFFNITTFIISLYLNSHLIQVIYCNLLMICLLGSAPDRARPRP
ncbi:hypothetical protein GX48_08415, partial [Paracoccidioides brasiliensis]